MLTKRCTQCQQEKEITEFYEQIGGKYGVQSWCKICANKYTREWRREHREENRRRSRLWYHKNIGNGTSRGRYKGLKRREVWGGHLVLFTSLEFDDWFKQQKRVCHYCRRVLAENRGEDMKLLTIDRKDNTKPYTLENIILSCQRCNLVKGSWFTEQQMLEIADKYFKSG